MTRIHSQSTPVRIVGVALLLVGIFVVPLLLKAPAVATDPGGLQTPSAGPGTLGLQVFLGLLAFWMLVHPKSVIDLRDTRTALPSPRVLLVIGLALRILVYALLEPANNDPHLEFIEFVVERGRLPVANEVLLGFQPPLYYSIAALFRLVGSPKFVQLFSLFLSLANLALIYRIVTRTELLSNARARWHALLFACLLPQFVIFGSFVSNDALGFPLGTLLFLQAYRYVERPTTRNLVLLGLLQGLGLLTKGTFIAFVPMLTLLILVVGLRAHSRPLELARTLALFLFVSAASGCYKFVENQIHFGTPIISNDILEQEWVARQQPVYVGPSSVLDVNVLRLVRHPLLSEHTRYSVPLLLYGTFWYSYIPESNFEATRVGRRRALPSGIYALGLLPTMIFFYAALFWCAGGRALLRPSAPADAEFRRGVFELLLLGVLLLHFALVIRWGLHHDAWSFFQSRLAFPAFLALALLLGSGWQRLAARRRVRLLLHAGLISLWAVVLAYYVVELTAAALG